MKWIIVALCGLAMGIASQEVLAAASPSGRFLGTLKHPRIQKEQLAKLDFITSREENNTLQLAAVLTLHFGGFDSGEYVTYHFEDVRFNLLTQTFVFNEVGQHISLVAKQYNGTDFDGELRSAHSPEVYTLKLSRETPPKPELPLIEPVMGEYQGKCESKVAGKKIETRLQVVTYRSELGTHGAGDPFGAYRIRGLLGEKTDRCGTSDGYCTWAQFNGGNYNFFKKRMNLQGKFRNLSCTVESDGLDCDTCDRLIRVSQETKSPRAFVPPTSKSLLSRDAVVIPDGTDSEVTGIQGEYQGWLHHEYLDTYQATSLNILTFQVGATTVETPELRMSAVASLFFGDHDSEESLHYSFAERSYPNPLIAPQFLFQEKTRDLDAILQVTKIGGGVVEGVWYSNLFGRVGKFLMKKGSPPQLPEGVSTMAPLSGIYESTDWELGVVIGQNQGQFNTHNPFSPLGFYGWTILYDVTPKIEITSGTYDFYTGKMGIEMGAEEARVGWRKHRDRLFLKKMFGRSSSPFAEFSPTVFRLKDGE